MEYRMNGEIYTPYAVAAGMLLHTNGKFTVGKLKSPLLSESFVLNRPSLSIMVHETKTSKTKTQCSMSWTPLSANKHK